MLGRRSQGRSRCAGRSGRLHGVRCRERVEEVPELVDPVDEALLGEGVDLEARRRRAVERHGLRRQVDRRCARSRRRARASTRRAWNAGVDRDRQEAVLERVLLEDVGERRRDDGAKTPADERPGRVLARRAAAEVRARDEDLRPRRVGPVQREVDVDAPVGRRRQSAKTLSPRPRLSVIFRKRAGMIWSVSTSSTGQDDVGRRQRRERALRLDASRGTSRQRPRVDHAPGDGRRGRGERGREERAASPSLPPLEVAVAGAHGVLRRG